MIKVTGEATVRETTAPYEHNDKDGKLVVTPIRVLYYSPLISEIQAEREHQIHRATMFEQRVNDMDAAEVAKKKVEAAERAVDNDPGNATLEAELAQAIKDSTAASIKARETAKAVATFEPIWLSQSLSKRLKALPDLEGHDGSKPIKITPENLERIAIRNLEAIEKAIADDLAPKEQPSK
jgi:hypothetical protein